MSNNNIFLLIYLLKLKKTYSFVLNIKLKDSKIKSIFYN